MKPKICIITVTFNSSKTIQDTLDSIYEQDYENFHHIVIDGKSSDNTLEIVKSHKNKNLTIISEPDNGIYDAMNKGLLNINGEIVGFLNSDDMYANNNVLSNIALVFEDNEIEACYGDLVYVNYENSKIIRYWKSGTYKSSLFSKGWCPPHPTFYVRKSALEEYGLFDTNFNLAADSEYMMRLMKKNNIKVAYINKVLIRMRVGGATSKSLVNIIKQNIEIIRALKLNKIKFSIFNFLTSKMLNKLMQILNKNDYDEERL